MFEKYKVVSRWEYDGTLRYKIPHNIPEPVEKVHTIIQLCKI